MLFNVKVSMPPAGQVRRNIISLRHRIEKGTAKTAMNYTKELVITYMYNQSGTYFY